MRVLVRGGISVLRDLRDLRTTLEASPCSVTTICVSGWDYAFTNGLGYGAELGSALTNNTSVTYLNLELKGLLSQHQESTSEELQPLLHFIATSRALRDVKLSDGRSLVELTTRILEAVAQNSNITEFNMDFTLRPSLQSFHVLTAASFLRTLNVCIEAFIDFSAEDLVLFGALIGQTQTLHELHLQSFTACDHSLIGERILIHLGSHAHHLRSLRLSLGEDATTGQFRALASTLHSAKSLSHVNMEGYTFDLDSMEIFLTALQSNTTVAALSFNGCRMGKGPFGMWAQFLQSDGSKIRELRFEPDLHDEESRDGALEGSVLESDVIGWALLPMVIQSSICALDLGVDINVSVPSYALLFDGMICHESEIRLSKLTIRALDLTVVEALARFLPHSSRLQELSTSRLFRQTNYRMLLSAIQQNGSLHRVEEDFMPVVDPVWLRLVTAYCQRNQLVPELLAQSQSVAEGTDDSESRTLDRIDLCLVPTILLATRQAPRMAPKNILIGLLGVLHRDVAGFPLPVAQVDKKRRAAY
jgi:hypothetical protein